MPIFCAHVTLGTAVSVVAGQDNMIQDVWVHNTNHGGSTYAILGGDNVGTATGMHLHSDETLMFTLGPGDTLYGISGQGSPTLAVMRIQKKD